MVTVAPNPVQIERSHRNWIKRTGFWWILNISNSFANFHLLIRKISLTHHQNTEILRVSRTNFENKQVKILRMSAKYQDSSDQSVIEINAQLIYI